MAVEKSIELPVSLFRGLTLKPSVLNRNVNSASLCSNLEKRTNGQGTVRKATQNKVFSANVSGRSQVLFPFTYTSHEVGTGTLVEELLAMEMSLEYPIIDTIKLYRVLQKDLTISYAGTGDLVISIAPKEDAVTVGIIGWNVLITANNITVYDVDYSSAIEAGSSNLHTLVAAIDALANISCSPSTLPNTAYAFVDAIAPLSMTIASGSSDTVEYNELEYISDFNDPSPYVNFNDANFKLPCALNYSNVIYFAYGAEEFKYDGRDLYLSGLPQASIYYTGNTGSGTSHPVGERFIYKAIFVRKDYKGNIIEGQDSDENASTEYTNLANPYDFVLYLDNIKNRFRVDGITAGANSRGAKINGTQVGVNTITVDAGHTLVIGDTAYFYDTSGIGEYVERTITGKAATTITVDGAVVNVTDNTYISNNTRVQLWRTKGDGTDFYFLEEIPDQYDAIYLAAGSFSYVDDTLDIDLIEPYVEQLRKKSTPGKCSFLAEFQGLKISSGDPVNPNRVRWTLPDDPEAYPLESNLTDIKGGGVGAVTAVGILGDDKLAVFKRTGHVILEGSLDDLNFATRNKSNSGIGCTSFRSLSYIGDNDALIGLSAKGVFISDGAQLSLVVGDNIKPLFDTPPVKQVNGTPVPDANWEDYFTSDINTRIPLNVERAVSINDSVGKKYHLYIPAEAGVPGSSEASAMAVQKYPVFASSHYLVFDYATDVPFWTDYTFYNRLRTSDLSLQGININAWAGFTLYKNDLWFGMLSRRDANYGDALLFKVRSEGNDFDYCEAGYPVYLDIDYTPFTREPGDVSAFLKALFINIYKFLAPNDPVDDPDFGSDFNITVKAVIDNKDYSTAVASTNVNKVFKVANGRTYLRTKCANQKARSVQIKLNNKEAVPTAYETVVFDNVELVYTLPYDKKSKGK